MEASLLSLMVKF